MMTLIDSALLDAVCAEAAASPRRRKHRNLHEGEDAVAHRLLNAVQPDSYIAPHRHLDPAKAETFVVLRGLMGLLIFDDAGNIIAARKVGAGETANCAADCALGVDIPAGVWHTAVALRPDTVILEAKAGPYRPLAADERASWAPAEGSAGAAAYLRNLRTRFEA